MYGFDYALFGDLVPEKCRVTVHQTEVILSLAKLEKGMWSRLLKEKHKVSNHPPVLRPCSCLLFIRAFGLLLSLSCSFLLRIYLSICTSICGLHLSFFFVLICFCFVF